LLEVKGESDVSVGVPSKTRILLSDEDGYLESDEGKMMDDATER
jgi:hypothetical protein